MDNPATERLYYNHSSVELLIMELSWTGLLPLRLITKDTITQTAADPGTTDFLLSSPRNCFGENDVQAHVPPRPLQKI